MTDKISCCEGSGQLGEHAQDCPLGQAAKKLREELAAKRWRDNLIRNAPHPRCEFCPLVIFDICNRPVWSKTIYQKDGK